MQSKLYIQKTIKYKPLKEEKDMTFKKICGIILGVVVAGFTSCSNDVNSDGNNSVNPNETARRALTIAVGNGGTRSVVSLETSGNKWESGDLFGAVNMTNPRSLEHLKAKGEGNSTKLEGNIDCANGDKIGVFFPYKQSAGQDQKLVEISMNNGIVSTNGNPAEYKQNGTIENLKYFDYSFGSTNVQVGADGSAKATGSVNMKKQYTILGLKFIATKNSTTTDITEKVKKVTISNVADEAVFKMVTGTLENKSELGTINIETSNLDRIYVAVFPDNNFSPKFTVETNDNKTYTVSVSGKKVEAAAYYPITLQVKEYIPNPPYIEIDGVKWGKYNLQYTPGKKTDGWEDGYHLAANPWDYYYPDNDIPGLNGGLNPDAVKFDRFRWGDISKAHNYANASRPHYSHSTTGISEKILDSNSEFGDLAYYASKHNWRLPTMDDFKKLMANTTQYVGYIDVDGHRVYGSLFIHDGVAHGYAVPNGVRVNKNASGVITNKNQLKESGKGGEKLSGNQLYAFTKERINEGIFFPAAGTIGAYNDGNPQLIYPGNRGIYWTADPKNKDQAYSFVFGMLGNQYSLSTVGNPTVGNDYPPKTDMYSIRPIYIGQ